MFYTKEINIYAYVDYEDELGINREGYSKLNELPIMVDMQPYSKQRAIVDFGFDVECTRRMFCDIIPEIVDGNYIEFNNKFYEIVGIPWDDGYLQVLLREVTEKVEIITEEEPDDELGEDTNV